MSFIFQTWPQKIQPFTLNQWSCFNYESQTKTNIGSEELKWPRGVQNNLVTSFSSSIKYFPNNVIIKRCMLYTYLFSGALSMEPSLSKHCLKAVICTYSTKILIFCNKRHGRWYLIAWLLLFTTANTFLPSFMAMQFPQMHLNLGLNCVNQYHVIILKRTMNLD